MAFNVTPTSGAPPYVLSATFAEQYLIDGVRYLLRARNSTSTGVCPTVGTTMAPAEYAEQLLSVGTYTIIGPVASGSCRTTTLQIVNVLTGAVVSESSVNVSNI